MITSTVGAFQWHGANTAFQFPLLCYGFSLDLRTEQKLNCDVVKLALVTNINLLISVSMQQ